jgi:F-type H+-transporting ATPase subunit b
VFHEAASSAITVGGLFPDFMTPDGQVLLWAIVVFLVLLGALWKVAWGPVMHALEQREKNIQKTIDDAAQKFKDAEVRVAEYEKKIHTVKDEAAAIIAEAKRDVEALKEDILKQAKTEADKNIERAKRDIDLARVAAVAEMRDKMVQLTADVSARVIEREIKAEDHDRFVNDAVQQLEKVS